MIHIDRDRGAYCRILSSIFANIFPVRIHFVSYHTRLSSNACWNLETPAPLVHFYVYLIQCIARRAAFLKLRSTEERANILLLGVVSRTADATFLAHLVPVQR